MNEQSKQKQTHKHEEQNDGCQMGQVKKVKGLRSTTWQLQNQSWGCTVQHREYSQ